MFSMIFSGSLEVGGESSVTDEKQISSNSEIISSINMNAKGSIADVISNANQSKVIVVPSPSEDGGPYQEYDANEAGFKMALFDLYQNGKNADFVIYIGTNISLSAATTAKSIPMAPSATDITLYALQGKARSITFTGAASDTISDSTVLPGGAKALNFGTNTYFGSNISLRNLAYSASNFYMYGHDLNLNGGSVGNGVSIYGGAESEDISGSPTINVNATGSGTWNIYGGNRNGGTLTGNTSINITKTVGAIANLVGGCNIGTVNGSTQINISDTNGSINNIYGGGVGSNASSRASVTGDVTTVINITNPSSAFQLGNFYGGTNYGDISGHITTNISGYGRFNTNRFVGGSMVGNIGSDRNKDAITTNLDTSLYKGGYADFEGGNRSSGIITGNIVNTVKAGTSSSSGGIGDFNGGGGNNISKLSQSSMGASNQTVYDAYTSDQRSEIARNSAAFKVFGNITSKLISGSFSNGANYTTAAGRGGYIEGNTTIEVGTSTTDGSPGGAGLAFRGSKPVDLAYSTTSKSRGLDSDWDIVGGGGSPGTAWDIYIKGNTKTILNNTVARWTYGGSFSGVVEGNTANTLNSGIVDTLEGTGYTSRRVYGNGQSTVNDGQVDWFLSGGGWDDVKIIGDVGVIVNDGVINASLGASYGVSDAHTVTGNSDNRIYGGNFSGTPRTGSNGFSGGITNNGSLLGDASLTIDLRNYDGEFKLPAGTYISGGNPYGSANIVGTNSSNKITLNIFTKPGSDVLNGADIYGDGGYFANSTKSGAINVNIQATGSKIGNLYATNYSNISSDNKILRNVTMNIQGAQSINGLSGGSAKDDFNNAIVSSSSNQVIFNFGQNVDGTGNYQTDDLSATGLGIVNFTQLNITNGIKLLANGGNINNGRLATAVTHASAYNQFGNIHLSKGSGIGILSPANLISGAKLIVEDAATIESPPGAGKINISDYEAPDDSKDHLTWIKNTAEDTELQADSQGTWFGNVKAYQVFTINPTVSNATHITPINFSGIEKATGKTFIGDNDIKSHSANGYGIAIPGSIIDYEVETPGVAAGTGDITHNLSQIKVNNLPLTIEAWGTDAAGLKVKKGRLLIPASKGITPTLSFVPETEQTGSWLYSGEISSTKAGASKTVIEEKPNSDQVDWTSPDNNYSYQVKVKYSNQVELSAKNVIINEAEAAKLKNKSDIIDLTAGEGRPFFDDSAITSELITAINQPLATDELYHKYSIVYQAGTTAANKKQLKVNIVVVKDDAAISDNRDFAIYAKSVRLTLAQAQAMIESSDLSAYTQATTVFANDDQSTSPSLSAEAFNSIKNAQESELLKNVSSTYSYSYQGISLSKTINVAISGELKLSEVPDSFNFGTQKISSKTQTYWPTISGNLIVKDTRGSERSPWRLSVKEAEPLTAGKRVLNGCLSYVLDGTEIVLGESSVVIDQRELTENGEYIVNKDWGAANQKGIKLTVPVEKQLIGNYQGTLSWTLVSAPDNP
ncbi:hypothetical protein HOY36_07395 [Enterococcus sp. MMGLQ5-2]|nr:WxL domain-containing protein [Enterococcus sp. MMGLQ5-2]MBS7584767.1 WxL domain-containing protein [Enterococcus sp. MMGLQ5-1]NPD12622.1 hypothetical protein [Enterococcus sp. MMGLQ5-1]NPD37194.1 hypothetical protein [Enterococcus sp. MMGLQ5-2]